MKGRTPLQLARRQDRAGADLRALLQGDVARHLDEKRRKKEDLSETKERRVRLCNEEFVRAMGNAMRVGPGHCFNHFRATRRMEALGANPNFQPRSHPYYYDH